MPLNAKRQRFVEEYLVDSNGAQAAIRAGYSPRTARSIANELLTVPDVRAAIDEALEAQRQRLQLTADDVKRVLWEIATEGRVEVARVGALGHLTKLWRDFSEKHVVSGDSEAPLIIERRTRGTA